MMAPVAALYDNPDNAAAEVRFLKRRGYAVRQVELGEEPDGQLVDAEDFATLYLRFAAAVRDYQARKYPLALEEFRAVAAQSALSPG